MGLHRARGFANAGYTVYSSTTVEEKERKKKGTGGGFATAPHQ